MYQSIVTPFISLALAVFMIFTSSIVGAGEPYEATGKPTGTVVGTQEASAGTIIADVFLIRPAGLAATVLGVATFILSLPFSLPTNTTEKAAQKLVVEPAKYTFTRPLGQL